MCVLIGVGDCDAGDGSEDEGGGDHGAGFAASGEFFFSLLAHLLFDSRATFDFGGSVPDIGSVHPIEGFLPRFLGGFSLWI